MNNFLAQIGFGGASLSSLRTEKNALKLLQTAFDSGIRHFDTAPLYGGGYSEMLIGKFMRNKRDQVLIASKFGLGDIGFTPLPSYIALPLNYYKNRIRKSIAKPAPASFLPVEQTQQITFSYTIGKTALERSLKATLKRLQTDYLDYYMIHEGQPSFLTDEALRYLQGLVSSGIVRQLGVASNIQSIRSINRSEMAGWTVLQYEYHHHYSKDIVENFPDKLHIHHSCMRYLSDLHNEMETQEQAGMLLAKAALENPNGKVLFSARDNKRIDANVRYFLNQRNKL